MLLQCVDLHIGPTNTQHNMTEGPSHQDQEDPLLDADFFKFTQIAREFCNTHDASASAPPSASTGQLSPSSSADQPSSLLSSSNQPSSVLSSTEKPILLLPSPGQPLPSLPSTLLTQLPSSQLASPNNLQITDL
ncbi:hypothetical protein ILYODFUR_035490 [Ilyodon furcidens]|uniref:Uncharacterized protein n=1 Tax=Ilyodon furcidens TaxID=33524 RepID=A0ABV0V0T0_9TELE